MNKLIVCIMGDRCSKFLDMCFKSVLEADKIIFCWGEEDLFTLTKYQEWKEKYLDKFELIQNKFWQDDLTMNGKQRNFYLNYLKENYPNDWALCLDADEVVDDEGINKIKEFIKTAETGVYSVRMEHFIQDLGHVDAAQQVHYVLNRLFKISEAESYPEVEHPTLIPKGEAAGLTDCTAIWHLAYVPNLWSIKDKYENHLKKSNIHTPEFLKSWYMAHIIGTYPKKQINLIDTPKVILDEFKIDKEEIYFQNRKIELKHPIQVKQWNDYFKPKSVLDLGCGRGCYLYFWEWFAPNSNGIEISKYAVKNQFTKDRIFLGDISDGCSWDAIGTDWDLITSIDVLEHLTDEQLQDTLILMSQYGKRFLFSIPFVGDYNLSDDKTHKQFKTKEEWINLIESFGIKIKPAPDNWLFKEQILIGIKE